MKTADSGAYPTSNFHVRRHICEYEQQAETYYQNSSKTATWLIEIEIMIVIVVEFAEQKNKGNQKK